MLDLVQKQTILNTVNKFLQLGNERFKDSLIEQIDKINVVFDIKSRTAGTASYSTMTIDLNPILIAENFELYLSDTIPHEVAHIVSRHFFGLQTRAHGKHWKYIMANVFNCAPSRCHSMDVSNIKTVNTSKYEYTCECNDTHMLSTCRHNKMQKKTASYLCMNCGSAIKFNGNVTNKNAVLLAQRKGK